jgi:hypothetical protein
MSQPSSARKPISFDCKALQTQAAANRAAAFYALSEAGGSRTEEVKLPIHLPPSSSFRLSFPIYLTKMFWLAKVPPEDRYAVFAAQSQRLCDIELYTQIT